MKIQIVDDNEILRLSLFFLLQSRDIEIVGLAGSVKEAVETARTTRPDIILMDYHLPDGTGAEATRQILKHQPGCKVIFLTVWDSERYLAEADRCGAQGYLLKYRTPSELIGAMRKVYTKRISGKNSFSC